MAIQKMLTLVFLSLFLFGCKTETKTVEVVKEVEKVVEVEKKLPQVKFNLKGFDSLPVTLSYQEILVNEQKPTRLNLSSLRVSYTQVTNGNIKGETRKEILHLEDSSYTLEFPEKGLYEVIFSGHIQYRASTGEETTYQNYSLESSFLIHTDNKEKNVNLQMYDWWQSIMHSSGERTPSMYDYLSHSGDACYLSENESKYDGFRVTSNETDYNTLVIICSKPAVLKYFHFVSENQKGEVSYYDDNTKHTFPSGAIIYKETQLDEGNNYINLYINDSSSFRIQDIAYEMNQESKLVFGQYKRKYDEVEKGNFIVLSKTPNKTTLASAYESAKVDEICVESANTLNTISLNGKSLRVNYQLEGLQCFKIDEKVNVPSLWLSNNLTSAWDNETITLESSNTFTLKRVKGIGLSSLKEIDTKF